jgi:hypothetical protein
MKQAKQKCEARERLLSAHQGALDTYSTAVSALSYKLGILQRREFDKLTIVAERARRLFYEAREHFDAHVDDHKC